MMVKEKRQIKTNVEIPKLWEQTSDGKFKADIPYNRRYGIVEASSIPDYVILIGARNNSIILYSDNAPIIPDGACLTFTRR